MTFWNKEIETMNRQELDALQLDRFKKLISYCTENVPFYRERFSRAGITAEKIKSLSDIEHIPVTTKEDIRDNYPTGLFAAKNKDIVRVHASSGTTGNPTVVGYTRNDINNWSEVVSRLLIAAGCTDEDIVQISFGYGLFTGALGLHYGLENIGSMVIPASSGNTEKQIKMLADLSATGLVSTPSYALHIAEVMKELGYKREDFKLRIGFFGSEGCSLAMRDAIEDALGIFATDNYGLSEIVGPGVSGDCYLRCGMHIAEDHFYPEIIDSKSMKVLGDGAQGELVLSTLTKEGIPLIRYRTKDITELNSDTCGCGRTHRRMDKIRGRSDDMLKIRGVNVFPSQIESVIIKIPQLGPHYQLIISREGFADRLEVKVELIDASVLESFKELEMVQKMVKSKLLSVLGIDCKVSLVAPKTIERYIGKAVRVVDLRNE